MSFYHIDICYFTKRNNIRNCSNNPEFHRLSQSRPERQKAMDQGLSGGKVKIVGNKRVLEEKTIFYNYLLRAKQKKTQILPSFSHLNGSSSQTPSSQIMFSSINGVLTFILMLLFFSSLSFLFSTFFVVFSSLSSIPAPPQCQVFP